MRGQLLDILTCIYYKTAIWRHKGTTRNSVKNHHIFFKLHNLCPIYKWVAVAKGFADNVISLWDPCIGDCTILINKLGTERIFLFLLLCLCYNDYNHDKYIIVLQQLLYTFIGIDNCTHNLYLQCLSKINYLPKFTLIHFLQIWRPSNLIYRINLVLTPVSAKIVVYNKIICIKCKTLWRK